MDARHRCRSARRFPILSAKVYPPVLQAFLNDITAYSGAEDRNTVEDPIFAPSS